MATKQRKFRVLAGAHVGEDRVYKKGQVVTTDQDLNTLFPNKFQELGVKAPDDDEVDPTETKVVVDGARSGPAPGVSTSESRTTQAAGGPVAADWATTERRGKGVEVEQPAEEEDEDEETTSKKTAKSRPSNTSKKST